MSTLAKVIVTAIMGILLTSCQFDINWGEGKRGSGNVVSETREITEDFTGIKATEGIDVYVTQAEKFSIEVEADDNIIELISTDIKDGMLKVHTEERIGRAKSKKVYVSLPTIDRLYSNSGADLYAQETIKADKLELDASSGADLKVIIEANEVTCDASSGADIKVAGTANVLIADASSGADIKAEDLIVKTCMADASSGADIALHVTESLKADASSGADIRYRGNPENVTKNKSASGSVHKY
ncbi:head GIN domain-containing protein [Sungkyunkwania multivorans]|uniref:Head GIN domain-containing protein n=1 Tax=Sungkyunkwania multivorans TaxID=1173618 RepID=A0ABW3CT16_9FLAO